MSFPPLPLEIIYSIIGQVTGDNDLCSLALCCRTFRDEAQRQLFLHPSHQSFSRQVRFLETINTSPRRLGPMVESYVIDLRLDTIYTSTSSPTQTAAGPVVSSMCNLTTLRILYYGTSSILNISDLLTCSFRLFSLEFGHYIEPLLFDFLRTQPGLRHLKLHGTLRECIAKELLREDLDLCPNLLSLSAEESIISIFLAQHRHIQRLNCLIPRSSTGSELGSLKSSQLSSMKRISLKTFSTRPNFSFLQKVSSLTRLDVLYYRWLSIPQLHYILENTTKLKHLIILHMAMRPEYADNTIEEVARAAFMLRTTLEYVGIMRPLLGEPSIVRFYAPGSSGEMETKVLSLGDVYVEEEFI